MAVILALGVSTPAWAWGQNGHRVTGALAEDFLSRKARAQVRKLLGVETLAEASTWPDEMRPDPSPFWHDVAGPFHYVTVPPGRVHADLPPLAEGDAVTALAHFSAVLKDPAASREEKQLALRFVVHIVGDLHQPLHAGNGTDRGGNDRMVTFRGESTNLHSVWDTGLIESRNLSYSELASWLRPEIRRADVKAWSQPDPEVWIAESTRLRDQIYPEGDTISGLYVLQQWPTVELRLKQAGVRIAAYLNALWD